MQNWKWPDVSTPDYTTIAGLRAALADLEPKSAVYIDNRPPTALSSYRGYYSDLAIERGGGGHGETAIDDPGEPFRVTRMGIYAPGSGEVRIKAAATVTDLIEALDLADGATFGGYKGGRFRMDSRSDLWVSEYGHCDQLQITRVEVLPGRVDFATVKQEW